LTNQLTLPDAKMAVGEFSEAALNNASFTLYDPQPAVPSAQLFTPSTACPAHVYTNGFLNYKYRHSHLRLAFAR